VNFIQVNFIQWVKWVKKSILADRGNFSTFQASKIRLDGIRRNFYDSLSNINKSESTNQNRNR